MSDLNINNHLIGGLGLLVVVISFALRTSDRLDADRLHISTVHRPQETPYNNTVGSQQINQARHFSTDSMFDPNQVYVFQETSYNHHMNNNDLTKLQSSYQQVLKENTEDYTIISTLEDVQALTRDLLHTINNHPEFVGTDKYRTLIDDLCGAVNSLNTTSQA